jgi:hypothetical protein
MKMKPSERNTALTRYLTNQSSPFEKPVWYDDWMRNPSKSGYEPSVFDTLRPFHTLKTTDDIYNALVLLKGGIPGLLERQILYSWWDSRLWTLVARLKSGLKNVRKEISDKRFSSLMRCLMNS